MIEELLYPFDGKRILRQKDAILSKLLAEGCPADEVKIAVMCGGTFGPMEQLLQMFLLNVGIRPRFYLSEPERYWEQLVVRREALVRFAPDVICIFTSSYDLLPADSGPDAPERQRVRWKQMWDAALQFGCPVIQNDFDFPVSGDEGLCDAVRDMNELLREYERGHGDLHVLDIHRLSALMGADRWSNRRLWYEARYPMDLFAMPTAAYALAQRIKGLFRGGRKVVITDLDGTIWGGILAENGPEGLEIGEDTPRGRAFRDVQRRLKQIRDRGVMLCIASKNDRSDVLAALEQPDQILRKDDFVAIRANWEPKDKNVVDILRDLRQNPESALFLDDSPRERELVSRNCPGVLAPTFSQPEDLLLILERGCYFQTDTVTAEDVGRAGFYHQEQERSAGKRLYDTEEDFLRSLELEISFSPLTAPVLDRVSQMHTRINRFNLTGRVFSRNELNGMIGSREYVTLTARLRDRFGDYGVISVMIGKMNGRQVRIESWLMSCRAFQRGVESAMLNEFVRECRAAGAAEVVGRYVPTGRNETVCRLLQEHGFLPGGEQLWVLRTDGYTDEDHFITVQPERNDG